MSLVKTSRIAIAAMMLTMVLMPANARAQGCGKGPQGFNAWVEAFKGRAASAGVSASAIKAGLSGVRYEHKTMARDRNQKVFKQSFNQFYRRRVAGNVIGRGRALMARHKATLDAVEKRYGVDRELLITIWALETDYGNAGAGNFSIPSTLATLAYDCRRSAFFEKELLATLKIIDRGDMTISQLRGGWAGEIGQTQFLPTLYIKYAVDFDGGGINLMSSVPDNLAPTARVFQGFGWKLGQPWGPGTSNHNAIREWNRATVYQLTIAKVAQELAGR
jgi:lytic murein transglycosylase